MAATMTIRPGPKSQGIRSSADRHFGLRFLMSRAGGWRHPGSCSTSRSFTSPPVSEGFEFQTVTSNNCFKPGQVSRLNFGTSKKDTKIVGTNSASHLESIKPAKNELKTNSFLRRKRCRRGPTKQLFLHNPGWRRPQLGGVCDFAQRRVCSGWSRSNHVSLSRNSQTSRTRCLRQPARKDTKIVGTNSVSHLESVKAVKNELKTNSFLRGKRCHRRGSKRLFLHNPGWRRPQLGGVCDFARRRVCSGWSRSNHVSLSRNSQTSRTRCLRQPAPTPPKFRGRGVTQKDTKIVGTNSASHLESIKPARNELKTNSFSRRKTCRRGRAKRLFLHNPGWRRPRLSGACDLAQRRFWSGRPRSNHVSLSRNSQTSRTRCASPPPALLRPG